MEPRSDIETGIGPGSLICKPTAVLGEMVTGHHITRGVPMLRVSDPGNLLGETVIEKMWWLSVRLWHVRERAARPKLWLLKKRNKPQSCLVTTESDSCQLLLWYASLCSQCHVLSNKQGIRVTEWRTGSGKKGAIFHKDRDILA